MNNIFNFKRFYLTLRKDVLENGRRYLMMFLVFSGIMTLIFTLISTSHTWDSNRERALQDINQNLLGTIISAFYSLGLVAASMLMKPMNSKAKRISYLVLPSSNFEKYLSRWLIVTVGFAALFFAGVIVSDCLRVSIASSLYPKLEFPLIDWGKMCYRGEGMRHDYIFSDTDSSLQQLHYVLLSFLFVHSLFTLGSAFRTKNSFPKTFITIAIIALLYISVCSLAIWACYPAFDNFGFVLEAVVEKIKEWGLTNDRVICCSFCVGYLFTFVNWTLAFFRFRESEITERL